MRIMLHSKIHRAYITNIDADYEGSITIDDSLLNAADILPYEQVTVLDCDNGQRFTTYALPGKSGEICVNGAAAKLVGKGDMVIILAYRIIDHTLYDRLLPPRIVFVDENNEM